MDASNDNTDQITPSDEDLPDIKALPIYQFKDEIVETVRRQRVTLIEGRTGCGKSGMVPQFIIDDCKRRGEPVKIIVTQPRRIACINLAKTVARMRKSAVGDLVGYQIGGEVVASDKCEVIYATNGYFIESLLHNLEGCRSYTHIILDEVHERDLDIDLLACVIRELMPSNFFKVILMSATLQGELFHEYFSKLTEETLESKSINVDISRFNVDLFHFDDILNAVPLSEAGQTAVLKAHTSRTTMEYDIFGGPNYDTYLDNCFDICTEVIQHFGEAGKTILVFLPGLAEIERFTDALHNSSDELKIQQVSLHSKLSKDEQEAAFSKVDLEACRVISATNVAETSVTLPNVHIVIDFGLQKEVRENISSKLTQIVCRNCSQAASKQRAGRTGRVCPGKVIRLYSKESLKKVYDTPHVSKVPLAKLLLTAKYLTKETLPELSPKKLLLRMIEPPEELQIDHALFKLSKLGAISRNDENAEIHAIGMLARGLPIDVEIARLVFFGVHLEIPCESIILAAVISCSTPLRTPVKSSFRSSISYAMDARECLATELAYGDGVYSEPITMFNIFKAWLLFLEDYCNQHDDGNLHYFTILAEFCRDKSLRSRVICLIENKVMEIIIALSRLLDCTKVMGQNVLYFGYLISRLRSKTNYRRYAGEEYLDTSGIGSNTGTPLQMVLNLRNISELLKADVALMKTLLLASFNHNIVFGTSLMQIQRRNNRIALKDRSVKHGGIAHNIMSRRGFDPARSVYFKSEKDVSELFRNLNECVTIDKCTSMGTMGLLQFSNNSDAEFRKPYSVANPETKIEDGPLMIHVIKRIASGNDNLRFKKDRGSRGGRVLHSFFHQPFNLRWEVLGRKIIGLIGRNTLVGNFCNVGEKDASLFGIVTNYKGTRNISYAVFEDLTVLDAEHGGSVSWLLLLCFHPGDCHFAAEVVRPSGTITRLKVELQDLGTIDTSVSILKDKDIPIINGFRKELSDVVKRTPKDWDRSTSINLRLQSCLFLTRRTRLFRDIQQEESRSWITLSPDNYSKDPFPAWLLEQ